jgi:hypothetical protein
MVSTYTTNKVIEKPGNGDYVDTWNVPANGDFDIIDQALGGVTSLNATSGSATLTDTQYRSLILAISGSMSANVTYTIPSGKGGQWIVRNTTTGGSYTVTIASGGGGTSVVVERDQNTQIYSDGTNVRTVGTTAAIPGSNTQVIYNSAGSLAGSANLTFDGSLLTAVSVADNIGLLRNVPINSQTSSYTLQASDNGKLISITTGGIVVPNSTFSAGNTVTIYNNSSSAQNITSAAGVTVTLVNNGTTGTRTFAAYGLATIACLSANNFIITGSGVL